MPQNVKYLRNFYFYPVKTTRMTILDYPCINFDKYMDFLRKKKI